MTRFSLFSYIENLETGALVLEDPFAVDQKQGQLCRYDLQRGDASLLEPDEDYDGFLRWHRFLPFQGGMNPEDGPLAEFKSLAHPRSDELAGLYELIPAPDLSKAIITQMAQTHPGAVIQEQPWTNPYRLECWRAIGLELAYQTREHELPATLVVEDYDGERLLGLIEAFHIVKELSGRAAYRLILLQAEASHGLCLAFEGNRSAAPKDIPEGALVRIIKGVTEAMGTAMRLAETSDDAVLDLLLRTRFADDEDVVYRLR